MLRERELGARCAAKMKIIRQCDALVPGSLSQNVHNCTIALYCTLLRSYQATGYRVYRGHSHIRIITPVSSSSRVKTI